MATAQDYTSGLAINRVLNLIRVHGPITRTDLGDISGYSRSTISINCDRLLEMGIVAEENASANSASKRKKLSINAEMGVVAGIELGATGCEIGLCDFSAELLCYDSSPITLKHGPEPVMHHIYSTIERLIGGPNACGNRLLGIGVGLPCSVDYANGFAVSVSFMPGWIGYPVRDLLSERYGCSVFVDNEVNTMALGEYSLGFDRQYKNLLFVKVGTGIGAGIIVDGNIYRGGNGLAGNIGHITVEGSDARCGCGRIGCLEAIAGGGAIARQAQQLVDSHQSEMLEEIARTTGTITAREVQIAAERGDETSSELIRSAGTTTGEVLGRLVKFFDPSVVIVGGGLTGFGQSYLSLIREGIMKQNSPYPHGIFPVRFSSFGDKAGIIGSAILCIKEIFNSSELVQRLVST